MTAIEDIERVPHAVLDNPEQERLLEEERHATCLRQIRLAEAQNDICTTPIGFVEDMLGLGLYGWQDRALAPLYKAGYGKPLVQITVLAPNEGGKSSRIVAGAGCYKLTKGWKVGITTKDAKQLNEQIIPAIEAQVAKFAGWHSVKAPYYRVTTPTGGTLIAFTTDDAARVEGLHGSPESPLLWIVDEAKSVGEHIFTGIDRCGYQALIYCSSGGLMQGTFWRSHYDAEICDTFVKVRAGLKDCPHIAPEKVTRIIQKYGEDHPFTRSSVYGEFMSQDDNDEYCISLPALLGCINNPPKHKPGVKAAFCDFGAGTAEHVLAVRDGNRIEIGAAWIESSKDATAGRFIREFIKAGFKAEHAARDIECDASDKEIWQKLANAGWTLTRRNFGAPPNRKLEYQSWGAEIWLEGAIKISNQDVILPDDDVLKAQLISRKKTFTATGKLAIEDKLSMAERGVVSPDRADAVLGVMSKPETVIHKQVFDVSSWRDAAEHGQRNSVLESIGAGVGY